MPNTRETRQPPPDQAAAEALAESMPPLAGGGLPPPHFHETGWRPGQKFAESDDPDRMPFPWAPPSFLDEADAAEQATQTTVQELAVPIGFARSVYGALNQEQCAELLSTINDKGFTPALLNIGRGMQQLDTHVRDGHRVIVDSPEVANWLLEVLRPHLPERLGRLKLVGLNERLRFLCYTPGQSFEEHQDGCYIRPRGHPQEGDRSQITVQLYLHDVPEENGGGTTFFPGKANQVAHQPVAGSVLLFTQNLPHEGSLVKAGLKYTVRTEVMYRYDEVYSYK